MKLDNAVVIRNPETSIPFHLEEKWDDIYFNNDILHFQDAIQVVGAYKSRGNTIIVQGTIDAKVMLQCYRCLESYEVLFNLCFDEEYRSGTTIDYDGYVFVNDTIVLNKMIEDAILLAMPIRSICKEECKGLCMTCGNNLNLNDCSCGM